MLPVSGRLVSGFGETQQLGGPRVRGIALSTRAGAQLVAPAAGRVAFAGPYRGYGNIVIIEHPGGWTSLVTGLARLDTSVGAQLLAGSPLGIATVTGGAAQPVVTVELRRDGVPVNPLEFVAP
jgi:septal ring factor EnvC (AmiA/AmiB activator)